MRPMSLVLPPSESQSIPIGIRGGASETGPRIGGRSPANVVPPTGPASYTYFLTVPLAREPYLEISIFLVPLDLLLPVSGTLENLGLVQIIVHAESRRGSASPLDSAISEHALSLDPEQQDCIFTDQGERIIAPFSKLGGRPYLIQPKHELIAALSDAVSAGFRHFLQIDFPGGSHDTVIVGGDWPFADGMFHAFGRPPFEFDDWLWLFEF